MQNMNWNYPTNVWFGIDRAKQIQPMKYKKLLEVYNDIDKYFLEDS